MLQKTLDIETLNIEASTKSINTVKDRIVAELLKSNPEGFTVSTFRESAGNTRKHALPLLGHLDETGVTRRRGDVRIAGPRLPSI